MRILFLADSNSPHILRWTKSICDSNFIVGIFSLHTPNLNLYTDMPDVSIFSINAPRELQTKDEKNVSKLIYLTAIKKLRYIIKEFKPDVVHSHYASSYGLIGALSGFHPYLISLWGGDIFSFPNKSFVHRAALKFGLSKADKILSTSRVMKEEAKKYTNKNISVIPFGIDTERFYPRKVNSCFSTEDIVIGTVKTLEARYGVEHLIKAFKLIKKKFPGRSLKLLIVGSGTQRKLLEKIVKESNLENETLFTGFVNHNDIQDFHNMLDIYVAMSLEESFGVAVLEASACGKPVVVSNVGGLPEVVDDGRSGFIVETRNTEALADILSKLINNPELRIEMGRNGRNKVLNEYDWKESVMKMISVYNSLN